MSRNATQNSGGAKKETLILFSDCQGCDCQLFPPKSKTTQIKITKHVRFLLKINHKAKKIVNSFFLLPWIPTS